MVKSPGSVATIEERGLRFKSIEARIIGWERAGRAAQGPLACTQRRVAQGTRAGKGQARTDTASLGGEERWSAVSGDG